MRPNTFAFYTDCSSPIQYPVESDLFGGLPVPLPSKAQEKFPAIKIHIIHNTIAMDCIEGLQADFGELLGDPDTADVVLKCQGKEIRAHKPILGARYCLVRYCVSI